MLVHIKKFTLGKWWKRVLWMERAGVSEMGQIKQVRGRLAGKPVKITSGWRIRTGITR